MESHFSTRNKHRSQPCFFLNFVFFLTLFFLLKYLQSGLIFLSVRTPLRRMWTCPWSFIFLILEMWVSFQLFTWSLRWLKCCRTEVKIICIFMPDCVICRLYQSRKKCLLCRSQLTSEVNKSLSHYCTAPWENKHVSKSRNFGVYVVQTLKDLYLKVIFRVMLYLWDMAFLQLQLYTCNFLFDGSLITKQISSNWVNFLFFGVLLLYTGEKMLLNRSRSS